MIQEQIIKFKGKAAIPDQILIGMLNDNEAEIIVFHVPVFSESQTVYVYWIAEDQATADVIALTEGEQAGTYLWTIRDSDTSIAQTMNAYIKIAVAEDTIWASAPFKLHVGDLPDAEGNIVQHTPTILEQVTEKAAEATAAAAEAGAHAAELEVLIPITAEEAPTAETVGVVGQHYTDTANDKEYVCTAATTGEYEWTLLNAGAATPSVAGLMSAPDKTKLNDIAEGAEVNQNAFGKVAAGGVTIEADAKIDTLTLEAGANVTLTPDAENDKIVIAAQDTTYAAATPSAAGLMSAPDKTKLNALYVVLTGTVAPTTATAGAVGQFFVKTSEPREVYQCVNASGGTYAWLNIANGQSVTTWEEVKRFVRAGIAEGIFEIGDQLVCTHSLYGELTWDIIGFDIDTPTDTDFTHSLTLQLHDQLPSGMMFDNVEALYYAENGLAAGTYNFTVANQAWYAADNGVTYQFTLNNDVPAGGQLVLNMTYNQALEGKTIRAFASRTATAVSETATLTAGSAGTSLGTADGQSANMNHMHRAIFGSNNYEQSAIRQWLGSEAAAGAFWTPQTIYDRPPSYLGSAGFLYGFDADFLGAIGMVTKRTAKNTVTDGGGYVDTEEKMFLLSRTEVYGNNENSIAEGSAYPYYSQNAAAPTDAAVEWRIKYRNGSAAYGWLRSPYSGDGHIARSVDADGAISFYGAVYDIGVAPACTIY